MQVLKKQEAYPISGAGTALALGYFDGVHLGHAHLIASAGEYAQKHQLDLAVFTFSFGQNEAAKGKLLLQPQQKYNQLSALGVQYCFEPDFELFHKMKPRDFFEINICRKYKAKALFCGPDFAFGSQRSGNTALLKELCDTNNMHLGVMPFSEYEGEPISSSSIRKALSIGNLVSANTMLGRPYEIMAKVMPSPKSEQVDGFWLCTQMYPLKMQQLADGVYHTLLDGKAKAITLIRTAGQRVQTFVPQQEVEQDIMESWTQHGTEVSLSFIQNLLEDLTESSELPTIEQLLIWLENCR